MHRWKELAVAQPKIGEIGEKLLRRPDQGEVALLGTTDHAGRPAMAPVCPIFLDPGMYVLLARHTPKHAHLARDQHYVLHAMVGADDLEFQIAGRCRFVSDEEERQRVLGAITFPNFDPDDPIVELLVTRALTTHWEDGQPAKTVFRSSS